MAKEQFDLKSQPDRGEFLADNWDNECKFCRAPISWVDWFSPQGKWLNMPVTPGTFEFHNLVCPEGRSRPKLIHEHPTFQDHKTLILHENKNLKAELKTSKEDYERLILDLRTERDQEKVTNAGLRKELNDYKERLSKAQLDQLPKGSAATISRSLSGMPVQPTLPTHITLKDPRSEAIGMTLSTMGMAIEKLQKMFSQPIQLEIPQTPRPFQRSQDPKELLAIPDKPPRKVARHSAELKEQVFKALEAGEKQIQIAKRLGIGQGTISGWVKMKVTK